MAKSKGRVTIPTDMDVVKETLEIMNEWGADAIRDCDGTEFPQEFMQPITQQERTTLGQRQIPMKFSRCIL